jgi:hypothetical protein
VQEPLQLPAAAAGGGGGVRCRYCWREEVLLLLLHTAAVAVAGCQAAGLGPECSGEPPKLQPQEVTATGGHSHEGQVMRGAVTCGVKGHNSGCPPPSQGLACSESTTRLGRTLLQETSAAGSTDTSVQIWNITPASSQGRQLI